MPKIMAENVSRRKIALTKAQIVSVQIELPRRVIQLLTETEDIVLNCFIGSGTTAIAALSQGRKYIRIDKEKRFVQIALKTVSDFERGKKNRWDNTSAKTRDVPEQMNLCLRQGKKHLSP